MKLLFIITALCAEVRPKLREELHGVIYLIEILDVILKESSDEHQASGSAANKQILTVRFDIFAFLNIRLKVCYFSPGRASELNMRNT